MTDSMLSKEKITVLLAEYTTLRAEVIQRSTWQIQMGAAATAGIGLGFALMIGTDIVAGIVLIAIAVMGGAIGMLFNNFETLKIVEEIKSLERRINDLAGDELLSHETRHGLPAESHAKRWHQFLSGDSN